MPEASIEFLSNLLSFLNSVSVYLITVFSRTQDEIKVIVSSYFILTFQYQFLPILFIIFSKYFCYLHPEAAIVLDPTSHFSY